MGLLNEDLEDTDTGEENGEEKTPYYGPNAIFAKIPCNYKNGRNAFQLQSNEDYSFDDGYTYYLLPSKFESGGDPQTNPNAFNYGEYTDDGQTVIAGTYTLLKVKDNSEIFEGKPFNVKTPPTGGPLKPETGSWTDLINDAKSWTIDLFFEDKDSTLKSIYSDMSNFLNPTIKTLTHQGVEPTGWGLNDVGNISSVDRFKDIPEVTTATEYMLDINSNGKITFFIRTPRLKRLIPIWDGNQLTFKKATGSEEFGEIIITTPKVEESKFRYKKNLLNEDTKTGCIEGDCQNGQGTKTYSDGSKYVGEWKDGKCNGQGTLTYSDGTEYVGEWKDGKCNGQGTLTYSDGTEYVGEFKDDDYNGQGTITYSNGAKYVGEWKDGDFNGQGTMTYSNGSKYVGEWKDGGKNGQGTYTFSDGAKYVGEWKYGSKNGQGTITYSNGAKYVGEWKLNQYNGQGTYTNTKGEEFTGIWVANKLNGKDVSLDDISNLETDFGPIANDVYSNLIKGKIPNVKITNRYEPDINKDNIIQFFIFTIKIGSVEYWAYFDTDGLKLERYDNNNHVKAVWNNRDLTTRPFTTTEKKDMEKDSSLGYHIQLLGGDKFIMQETLKRFKQLIK